MQGCWSYFTASLETLAQCQKKLKKAFSVNVNTFFSKLDSGITCQQNACLKTDDLNNVKPRVFRLLLSLRFFEVTFSDDFYFLSSCLGKISVKKNKNIV